ncbi:hypothetical protein HN51_019786 [Arachis hypogaea]|uniref:Transmembrane protein n=2 Tax=Arachis TaxID=3817 RepID=A0A445BY68_ARAHY|nr:uncharacterized protein LOC107462387 [Arachis duranensis]XP_025614771.1 uncharacterized protein LOC112707304 [Arachis hypogaea]QHO31605.1 uncharacterized protein DS421_8g243030 [Arachis hypogaea]RYR43699.1 hypothetical protein Ahy_A08g040106 [Arachis hypogaea]
MDTTHRNGAPMREENEDVAAKFKESLETIVIYLNLQLSLVSFFKGQDFFATHPNVGVAMVFFVQLLFFVGLLGTMLGGRVSMKILRWIILVLGGVSSVLVQTMMI